MTQLFPIVLETEDSGAVSAYVPGLPVYAASDTYTKAERAIRTVLAAYLDAHPDSRPTARVRVARSSTTTRAKVDIVGPAALVGARRSATKARNHDWRRDRAERSEGTALRTAAPYRRQASNRRWCGSGTHATRVFTDGATCGQIV